MAAVLISLDHGLEISPYQFNMFMDWLANVTIKISETNEDTIPALGAQFTQVLEARKPRST